MDFKLEVVPIPVTDVDKAKAFYEQAGFGADVDVQITDEMRLVQLTPPGSGCSIHLLTGTPGPPPEECRPTIAPYLLMQRGGRVAGITSSPARIRRRANAPPADAAGRCEAASSV